MYSIVLTTTASLKEARRIVRGLLEKKLIACGNIIHSVESHFVWNKKMCKEREYLIFLKTTEKNFKRLKDFILSLHSYETPEIILVPIKKGFDKYLSWINNVVG